MVSGRTDAPPRAAHGTLDSTLLKAPLAFAHSWTHLGGAWSPDELLALLYGDSVRLTWGERWDGGFEAILVPPRGRRES